MTTLFKDQVSWETYGETISAGTPLYKSTGTGNDSGRTAGRLYKLEVTLADRKVFYGIAKDAGVAADTNKRVITAGRAEGFTALTAGVQVYAGATAGTYTQTAPTSNIQVIGIAKDADTIMINGALGGSFVAPTNLPTNVSGVLPLANGGTNKNMTPVAGGVVYTDADSMEVTAAGTSGQVLQSNGSSAPTWGNPTAASLDTIFQLTGGYASTWSTGDNAAFLGGGTLSGTFVDDSSTPLQGTASAVYTQAAGSLDDYLASPAQSVDIRFRGQECTLFFPFTYDGANNDIEVIFYDDTNTAIIPSSAFIQASTTVGIFKTNIVIPSTCASIRVGFMTRVLNSGKIFEFDSVQLTSDNTVYASVNNLTSWQSYTPTFTGFGTATNIEFQWRQNGQNVDIRGKFTSGTATAVEARISLPNGLSSAGTSLIPSLQLAGYATRSTAIAGSYTTLIEPSVTYVTFGLLYTSAGGLTKGTGSGIFGTGIDVSLQASIPINGLQASSTNILTAPDTFSTDTAPLVYAGSGTYTPATLPNALVGTFITFTYAASTNTATQTTTAPTQTTSDMASNGFFVTGRAYNVLSTAALPCRFDIQIGKGLKGTTVRGFTSVAKDNPIGFALRPLNAAFTNQAGTEYGYDPDTGILTINAGSDQTATSTTRNIGVRIDTAAAAANGYFTVDASKNPALTGLNINAVAARGVNTAGTSMISGDTTVVWDSVKTYDTHSALNSATGLFTAPESGFYQASWGILLITSAGWGLGESFNADLYKNGAVYAKGYYHEIETAVTAQMSSVGSSGVYLSKGETLNILVTNTSGGSIALLSSAGSNYFSIHKTNVG